MKILLILALAARAAAADSKPPDRTASLGDGPPSIDLVMVPPVVDTNMVIVPPPGDQAILLGPARDLLGHFTAALVDTLHWFVPATI
jgi:hypothetical protein